MLPLDVTCKQVEVYRPNQSVVILDALQKRSRDDVLSGFKWVS
ncbi:hypothetical protein CKA32_005455 [Geitlerinema sp. FC II]|nr:hypothetical protein CKA32_005455 [Geitlerinema sp. FC II]